MTAAMDPRTELREFLTSRRARLSPEQIGLPDFGGRRRVPGLRREEVALVAGISVEYYVRLERGNAGGVSDSVVEGVSRALQLDDAERAHLWSLVRAANAGVRPVRRGTGRQYSIRPGVQRLLDAMVDVPAYVQNGRLDVIAVNSLGRALYSELLDHSEGVPNFGRFMFLDHRSEDFLTDWDGSARQTVALLRAEAGRSPYDRALSDLVGELSTRSEAFRKLWAAHDVRSHSAGPKGFRHPVVGEFQLDFEALEVTSGSGTLLVAFTAAPGSPAEERLQLLANWAGTSRRGESVPSSSASVWGSATAGAADRPPLSS